MRTAEEPPSAEALTGFRWLVVGFGQSDGLLTGSEASASEAYLDFKRDGLLFVYDGSYGLNGRYETDHAVLGLRIDAVTANAVIWAAGPNVAREQHEAIPALCPPGGARVFTAVHMTWSGLTVTLSANGIAAVIRRAGYLPLP